MSARLTTVERTLDGRRDSSDRVVDVLDDEGRLICWCGPYSHREAMHCRELFEHGAVEHGRSSLYRRCHA